MFAISSKNTKYKKIAKIKGGENKNKFLIIKPYNFKLDDLPKSFINRLSLDQVKILDIAIKSGFEPDDEYMKNTYYDALQEFQKLRRKGIKLHTGKFLKEYM